MMIKHIIIIGLFIIAVGLHLIGYTNYGEHIIFGLAGWLAGESIYRKYI